jgi:hypothetical protein
MGDYPETIVLDRDSEEYTFLTSHSDLIKELSDIDPVLELSADILFAGDEGKWKSFVDIFFPELGIKPYFGFRNRNVYVLPERGTRETLEDFLDFFMVRTTNTHGVGQPANVIRQEMMNFAKKQARKQMNAPRNQALPGVGAPRAAFVVPRAQGYEPNWNNNNNREAEEEEEEENNIQLGQREENEPYLARLRPQNRARFVNERRGGKSNRRTRRNKSHRKNRKQTRRRNRK